MMETPRLTRYMEFRLVKRDKTEVWQVLSTRRNTVLGWIKWHGAWFRYAFFPESNTIFDAECMSEIIKVLNILMNERR